MKLQEEYEREVERRPELAYRRGVHQALDRASRELRQRGHEAAADLLAAIAETASQWRSDKEDHHLFLDELFSKKHRKFVLRLEKQRRRRKP